MSKKSQLVALLIFSSSIFLTFFPHCSPKEEVKKAKEQLYTCGMHPSVKVTVEEYKKGNTKCPICQMDLTLIKKGKSSAKAEKMPIISLSEKERQLAGIETAEVRKHFLVKEITAPGKIQFDERKVACISSWVKNGRIEKLYVDFTGVKVRKGNPLALLYSPSLLSTQEEYLLALQMLEKIEKSSFPEAIENAKSLVRAAEKRLLLWGVSAEEIKRLKKERKTKLYTTIFSPLSGVVVEKKVVEGQYVKEGTHLYTIADLSHLWVLADVHEDEIAWIELGQKVEITTPAYPAEVFSGKVSFIEPRLNQKTRTIKIRIDLPNPKEKLKPEMLAKVKIKVPLREKMFPALVQKERAKREVLSFNLYRCPCSGKEWRQPAREQKKCPYCGPAMPDCGQLVKQIKREEKILADKRALLAIPLSALLDSGKRKLVYVEKEIGEYEPRVVKVGPRAGEYYPVLQGLSEGERVVVRANFLIDSQSQLTGQEAAVYDAAIGK